MTTLTQFTTKAASLRVMEHNSEGHGHDIGSAADCFGSMLDLICVGDPQGEDEERGAYEWHILTLDHTAIGELRDDAAGWSIHIRAADC